MAPNTFETHTWITEAQVRSTAHPIYTWFIAMGIASMSKIVKSDLLFIALIYDVQKGILFK